MEEVWVVPEVMVALRELAGLTREEVSERVAQLPWSLYPRISAQRLAEWECGDGSPELPDLEALSDVYDCPIGAFFYLTPEEAARATREWRRSRP
ncbi:MAG: helix-turn-helix domain-containing protein [Anaerolineae bacterium]